MKKFSLIVIVFLMVFSKAIGQTNSYTYVVQTQLTQGDTKVAYFEHTAFQGALNSNYQDLSTYASGRLAAVLQSVQCPQLKTDGTATLTIATTRPLNGTEQQSLKQFLVEQLADGWGEGFEQMPIEANGKQYYLSLYNGTEPRLIP